MKRIFLALRLEDTTRTLLSGLGSQIAGSRPVADDQLHLTLRFIGDVDGVTFDDIWEQLWEISASPVSLAIRGVGHFPPRGRPRTLWAGIEPSGELLILRNKINRILRRCNVLPEQRKFHPHITLARLKNSSPHRVARFLSQNSLLKSPPFTVGQFTLYSSVLSPKGAVHTIEQEYPLRGDER